MMDSSSENLRGARRVAASMELGRRHPYLTLYGLRMAVVAAVVFVAFLGYQGVQAVDVPSVDAPHWAWFAGAPVALFGGYRLATRSRRRGYRLPRRRY